MEESSDKAKLASGFLYNNHNSAKGEDYECLGRMCKINDLICDEVFARKCICCNEYYSLDYFYKKPNGRHGRDSRCKQCVLKIKKQKYASQKREAEGRILIIEGTDKQLSLAVVYQFYSLMSGEARN